MAEEKKYWFPAKKYGWGWGAPVTWQGWLVMLVFLGALVAGALYIDPKVSLVGYVAYVTLLGAALIGVCYKTGEPPRWRWGDKKK
jgi:hypothetical protein